MAGGWQQVDGCGLMGEWVAGCVGWCVNRLVPPTPTNNISLLSHACQRQDLVLQSVGGRGVAVCAKNHQRQINA